MSRILAIDAGGTSTRAVVVDTSGRVHGYATAGSGNPVSAGAELALESWVAAATDALGGHETPVAGALVVMAGASAGVPTARLAERLAPLGLSGEVRVESDLLGAYCSGTIRPDGCALVAGTGAVAARIAGGRLHTVADGTGWLLGDEGSGYWVGHRVATAVVAALDGRGPETALTGAVLHHVGLAPSPERVDGRPAVLLELMRALYAARPVELARFAPLALELEDDAVAASIVAGAVDALTGTLTAVRGPHPAGPVVLGGGLLTGSRQGGAAVSIEPTRLGHKVIEALGEAHVIPVGSGVVGAAVLGLRSLGQEVDDRIFASLRDGVAQRLAT